MSRQAENRWGFRGPREGTCRIRKLRHRRHTCEPHLPAAGRWLVASGAAHLRAGGGFIGRDGRRKISVVDTVWGQTGMSRQRMGRPAIHLDLSLPGLALIFTPLGPSGRQHEQRDGLVWRLQK